MRKNIFKKLNKIFRYALLALVVFVFAFSGQAHAAIGDGVFIYDQTTPTTNIQERTWTGSTTTVGPATSPFAGVGTSKHVYAKGSQTRQEILLGVQNSAGLLTIYMSTDDGASWVSQWTATVGDGNLKRYEIAYEQNSGDALVIYSANAGTTNEIKYQVWNGTVWSGALNLDVIRTSGTIYGIRAAERSGSDEIGIVWVDTNNQMSANLWTGSAWYGEPSTALVSGTYTTIARSGGAAPSAVPTRRGYDLAFESLSGDLMVVWGNDSLSTTQVDPRYIIKTAGGAWGAAAGTAIANLTEDGEMIDIAASPISDKIALSTCSVDTGADCNAIVWSGTAWGAVSSDTSSAAAIVGESSNNVEWLVDGANEVAIMTYSDSAGGGIDWRTAANGTTIVAQTDDVAAPAIVGLERAGFSKVNPADSREAVFIFEDANADIFVKRAYLTGTTVVWSNPTGLNAAIETNASVTGFNPIGFAFIRFVPAPTNPDAASFVNNTEGTLLDGGRSGQQITITGTNFGTVPAGVARANCAGGVGTGCIKIGGVTVASGDITGWTDTQIVFSVNSALGTYGGISALEVTARGTADLSPVTFYIYPNITQITDLSDVAITEAQIGQSIKVKGDHFGANGGSSELMINGAVVTVIPADWSEVLLNNAQFPGQTGIINGTIKVTRNSDSRTAQVNFNTKALSIVSSSSSPVENDQIGVMIHFNGSGIDTDTTGPNIRPIFYLKKTGQTPILGDNTGVNYGVTANYQDVYATFNLSGANVIAGAWDLELTNMDGSVSTCSGCLTIENRFVVNSITPGYGLNSGIINISSVGGSGFKDGATVKLNKGTDILASTVFTFTDPTTLSNGAFDLTGQALGFWDVVVTNPGPRIASYSSGFEIRSANPTLPVNIYQFKTNTDIAEPPTANIAAGGGIGGGTAVYFRMDMQGGLTGRYYPQVEVKPVGAAFECIDASPTPCVLNNGGFFAENSTDVFSYDGITPVQGWVNINGVDGASYHWQVRVRNSGGTSNWVSFGGNLETEADIYIDNTVPVISLGTDNTCATAAPLASVTDLGALIQWDTLDATSGGNFPLINPPAGGTYAKGQVDYKKGIESWSSTPLSAWENSRHKVTLSGLVPATTYTYRVRAQDYVGNEATSSECTFLTTSSRPIKTVEFFIGQETLENTGGIANRIAKDFSFYLPESPGEAVSVRSAFIEITGISGDGAQAINVELRKGLGAAFAGTGTAYNVDSAGTTTPFTILFNALDADIIADGSEIMDDVTQGASTYSYTLFLENTGGVNVSAYSAKLIITYSYAQ